MPDPKGEEATISRSDVRSKKAAGGMRQEGTLPISGQVVVMSDLSGRQELAALSEVGTTTGPETQQRLMWAQAMRSCISISPGPGKPAVTFDESEHDCESFRDLFCAIDFAVVMEMFLMVNRPTEVQAEAFRKSTRLRTA